MNEHYSSQTSDTQDDGTQNADAVVESRYAWLRGFIAIFFSPENVGRSATPYVGRVLVCAALLWAAATVSDQYLMIAHSGLRSQTEYVAANDLRALGKSVGLSQERIQREVQEITKPKVVQANQLPTWLAWSIVYSFVSMTILSILYWVLVRLFNPEPPSVAAIASTVAYGSSIAALGLVVIGISKFLTGSIFGSPSLAFLSAPLSKTHMLVHTLLTKLNIFTVWEYIAVGIAVAARAGMGWRWGIIFSAVAFLIAYGTFSIVITLFVSFLR